MYPEKHTNTEDPKDNIEAFRELTDGDGKGREEHFAECLYDLCVVVLGEVVLVHEPQHLPLLHELEVVDDHLVVLSLADHQVFCRRLDVHHALVVVSLRDCLHLALGVHHLVELMPQDHEQTKRETEGEQAGDKGADKRVHPPLVGAALLVVVLTEPQPRTVHVLAAHDEEESGRDGGVHDGEGKQVALHHQRTPLDTRTPLGLEEQTAEIDALEDGDDDHPGADNTHEPLVEGELDKRNAVGGGGDVEAEEGERLEEALEVERHLDLVRAGHTRNDHEV
mmetsp:Transcript_48660/g.105575  ORF Transcript_48660/g.105575 Transcript_48660/m.105575 type:complete len:280 (+) Transcript_48660:1149-1988(+)